MGGRAGGSRLVNMPHTFRVAMFRLTILDVLEDVSTLDSLLN